MQAIRLPLGLAVSPGVYLGIQYVERECAVPQHFIVEGSDVEFVAKLLLCLFPQFQNLKLTEFIGQGLASLDDHIKNERSFYATYGQQVLDLYTKYARGMEPELPKLFGHLPKSKLTVIPMEASRSKNAVPADYTDGAADGSRPGHINVNEWDHEHRL